MMQDVADLNPLDLFNSFVKDPDDFSFKECFNNKSDIISKDEKKN